MILGILIQVQNYSFQLIGKGDSEIERNSIIKFFFKGNFIVLIKLIHFIAFISFILSILSGECKCYI